MWNTKEEIDFVIFYSVNVFLCVCVCANACMKNEDSRSFTKNRLISDRMSEMLTG